MNQDAAIRRIFAFKGRFGEAHFYFACHAAFPLALTPDLLYRLWANFQTDSYGEPLNIQWMAVADLLLSSLCEEVGHELYEMPLEIRNALLQELKQNNRFGASRIHELAEFLAVQVSRDLDSTDIDLRDYAESQYWIALAYIKPGRVAEEIQIKIKQLKLDDYTERRRINLLVETLSVPLRDFLPKLLPIIAYPQSASLQIKTFGFTSVVLDKNGQKISEHQYNAKYFEEKLGNGITLEMVEISDGEFIMGSPRVEEGSLDREKPQHKVKVASFFLGKFPVTQAQWEAVAELPKAKRDLMKNPSTFKGGNLPVECISWHDAVEFCERLTLKTGRNYRLPSESEWEYACRAGTTTAFHFGDAISSEFANYRDLVSYGNNSKRLYRGETTPVGYFNFANSFGLYDMHGNVFEWCLDYWHDNYEKAPNYSGAWTIEGRDSLHILRGGSWNELPIECRSAYRHRDHPNGKYFFVGFRVACTPSM
ncbi:MAG: formylglycine-generating enzyme family protein [Leptolyngbyaceae cyanobacterium bins.302]|nr:formylglycine-generating enzyme family protein [Leptolyngbyaceae cyanobacterium bins.302]